MKNHIKRNIVTLGLSFTACLPALANDAGLFVEPMLTYERGKAKLQLPAPFNSSRSTVNGFGLGARLGLHVYESMFLGLDARYSRPTYKNEDTGVDRTADSYNIGPMIGVQMPTPFGVRVWAGYIMAGEMDVKRDDEVDFTFEKANGYRVGGGVKLTLVSLNLEYQDIKYDRAQLSNASIFSGTTSDVDQTNKSMVFSVSFPISI